MLQNVTVTPSRRALEFGIYRDGDNNLDEIQDAVLNQAFDTSAKDSRLEFTVENTSTLHAVVGGTFERGDDGELRTDEYRISDGEMRGLVGGRPPHEMSDGNNLARFVARTLDNAEKSGATQTWIDLVDHGGGDGGGLQTSDDRCMAMPDIAKAISDGVALHARNHPEDGARRVDGVVANQCLMDTLGFADALSHAGVAWLAASPETMLAPGVPSNVAHVIASHQDDPKAMARSIVADVMRTKYDANEVGGYGPAAAFDVLDLNAQKIARADGAIKQFNDDVTSRTLEPGVRRTVRDDVRSVDGMVRFPEATGDMPWHADRPAIAMYDTIASDGRLDATLRHDAKAASDAVRALVLAHRESSSFAPFGGADYSNAVGPTIHAPIKQAQIDPWSSAGISETGNAFYRSVDQDKFAHAIA